MSTGIFENSENIKHKEMKELFSLLRLNLIQKNSVEVE